MKLRISNSIHTRTVIICLLVVALLSGQLTPAAIAIGARANHATRSKASRELSDRRSITTSSISTLASETNPPLPQPVPQPIPATAPLAVNIVATKTDNRTVAQPAAPGDTINYTIVIQNLGSTDATNVTFTDTIDANTTLVPNSIISTPVANYDTYNVVGNVRIQPNAAQGLLTNDFNRWVLRSPTEQALTLTSSSAWLPEALTWRRCRRWFGS